MNTLFCFQPQNNMPQPPFAAQREKGWGSCAHFAPSSADATAIIMDTILMVSIFVIPALRLLYAVLCLALLVVILTALMIPAHHSFITPKEQP